MPDRDDTQDSRTEAKARRPRVGRALIVAALVVALSPALALGGLMAYHALFRGAPERYAPAGFEAYVSLDSAGAFARDVLDLEALDAILSPPAYGSARRLVASLRSQAFLRTALYDRLAGVRLDASLYPDGGYVATASLGFRAAFVRAAPLALRLIPALARKAPGLGYDASAGRFEWSSGDLRLYAVLDRDVLVVASSEALLSEALAAGDEPASAAPDGDEAAARAEARAEAIASALAEPGRGSLRLLVDPAALVASRGASLGGIAGTLARSLSFPTLAAVDLSLSGDRISLSVDLPLGAVGSPLEPLLARRSSTPAILSRLPESAVYYSLLAAGRPGELWEALSPALGPRASEAYAKADDAARMALGQGLEALFLSWMGPELGVFGSSRGAEPVFFVSIADEKARRAAFDAAFSSLVVGRDVSAVVGGQRVPRAVFPGFIRGLASSLGINLAEPFYLVEDGFLFASQSAELLASCVAELREGRLLVKTERWKDGAAGVSPESSASLYYSLDRSIPFFMRGSSGLEAALRLYGRGVASVSLTKGGARLELSAVAASGDRSGPRPLPGFPVKAGNRMASDPLVARSASGSPMAYWTSGSSLHGLDLSSGSRFELALDDPGAAALETRDGRLEAVWAVSERGTVYRLDRELASLQGFPVLTGQRVSGPPAVVRDAAGPAALAVPVAEEPSIMFVGPDGRARYSVALGARLRSRPVAVAGAIAALPRSFDSWLYALAPDGLPLPGWPVALPGIASAAPALIEADASPFAVALTEGGELCAFARDGAVADGFPVVMDASFDAEPAWAASWRAIYAVSVEGTLYRTGPDGARLGRRDLERGGARGSTLAVADANGDGREELYVSGGGNALYAYSGDLEPLPGFPVSGSGAPAFIDINGDGRPDLVTRGADDTIHAYTGL